MAVIALLVWLVILIVIGPMIYLEDKGPIFYNAPRLGKDGKVFTMYKFRSMKVNAPDIRNEDGSTFNSEADPRLTRIGKFLRKTSLDETPQILNVIKGDMSIVGPRPDLPDALHVYNSFTKRKLEVKPGITGYNQAFFRNSVQPDHKFGNDVYYVDNMSFVLDIRIIAKTVGSVSKKNNVFIEPDCFESESREELL